MTEARGYERSWSDCVKTVVIKGKTENGWSAETVHLIDISGRYSRLRRAGLRFFERVRSLSSPWKGGNENTGRREGYIRKSSDATEFSRIGESKRLEESHKVKLKFRAFGSSRVDSEHPSSSELEVGFQSIPA